MIKENRKKKCRLFSYVWLFASFLLLLFYFYSLFNLLLTSFFLSLFPPTPAFLFLYSAFWMITWYSILYLIGYLTLRSHWWLAKAAKNWISFFFFGFFFFNLSFILFYFSFWTLFKIFILGYLFRFAPVPFQFNDQA